MNLALWASIALAAPAEPSPAAESAPPAVPDRSAPPPVPASELLVQPEPEIHSLGPGVTAWYVRVPGVRKVAVQAVLGRGLVELEGGPDPIGRATGALADVAAGGWSAAELSSERDLYEIELWSSIGLHDGAVGLSVPKEELGRGMALERLVLCEPSFPKKDLKRWILDQELYYTVNGPASQAAVASAALAFAWFPADHPYGIRPDLGRLREVKGRALRERWQRWIHQTPLTLLVTGDLSWEEIAPALRSLGQGLGAEAEPGQALPVPLPKRRVIAVDLPGQSQVAVRLRLEGPDRTDSDLPAMIGTNFMLGGHFLSRLNHNLREVKGFTYGAGSQLSFAETWGSLSVAVDVKAENVAATVQEIERELGRLVDEPVPPEELDAMRRSLNADWNRSFETADSAMGLYRRALVDEMTVGDLRKRLVAVGETTPEDVARAAKRWLSADRSRVWVFVGDRRSLEPQLEGLGAQVEWVDPSTAILGRF